MCSAGWLAAVCWRVKAPLSPPAPVLLSGTDTALRAGREKDGKMREKRSDASAKRVLADVIYAWETGVVRWEPSGENRVTNCSLMDTSCRSPSSSLEGMLTFKAVLQLL